MQTKKGKDNLEDEIIRKNGEIKKEEEIEKTRSRVVRVEKKAKKNTRKIGK